MTKSSFSSSASTSPSSSSSESRFNWGGSRIKCCSPTFINILGHFISGWNQLSIPWHHNSVPPIASTYVDQSHFHIIHCDNKCRECVLFHEHFCRLINISESPPSTNISRKKRLPGSFHFSVFNWHIPKFSPLSPSFSPTSGDSA